MPIHPETLQSQESLLKYLQEQEGRVAALEQKPAPQSPPAAAPSLGSSANQHPVGLCATPATCPSCSAALEPILTAAYNQGWQDGGDSIDQALILAAGKPMRDQIAGLVAQGQQLANATLRVSGD